MNKQFREHPVRRETEQYYCLHDCFLRHLKTEGPRAARTSVLQQKRWNHHILVKCTKCAGFYVGGRMWVTMPGGGNLVRSERFRKAPRTPRTTHARYYYTRSLVLDSPIRKRPNTPRTRWALPPAGTYTLPYITRGPDVKQSTIDKYIILLE